MIFGSLVCVAVCVVAGRSAVVDPSTSVRNDFIDFAFEQGTCKEGSFIPTHPFPSRRAFSGKKLTSQLPEGGIKKRGHHLYCDSYIVGEMGPFHRCEVRPGPEYLLRWHYYSENGTFSHNTFVYLDDGCSKPVWSRCVKGRYGLRGKSWLMAGASQADFTLQEVMVIVYSGTMAQDLSSRANTSCPGVVVGQWMPEVEYIVYKHQEKNESAPPTREEIDKERSCMALLKLSYEDVGLLRIQRRPPLSYDSWGEREELLLGETKAKVTVFADPLIRANQTGGCGPCQVVHKSTLLYPPLLDLKPPLPLHLTGEWVSMRCEIKHHGLFLRRRLRVSGKSWHAEYWFYSDPKCTAPTLLAAAEGNYAGAGSGVKSKVLGASDYDFHVERAFLTVFEKGLAESLQADGKCGPSGEWQVGVARDLTSSGGCPALGIALPTTEFELVRMESDASGNAILFLGQSEERKGEKKERPTHFQPPLLQCATPEFPLTHFLNSFNAGGPLAPTAATTTLPLALLLAALALV